KFPYKKNPSSSWFVMLGAAFSAFGTKSQTLQRGPGLPLEGELRTFRHPSHHRIILSMGWEFGQKVK
ncbi:MAG: hypothetical protein AB8F95_09095, partial [Bacteroidia bacterium]